MDSEKETLFIENIDKLSSGERAVLKRSCGKMINEASAEALGAFYKALPYGVSRNKEDRWFFAGALRCMWKPEEHMEISLEKAIADYASRAESSDSYEKRMVHLLDMIWDEDGFMALKVWRTVKLLKQNGYVIDMVPLIKDLCFWNSEDRFVQRKWARAYWHDNTNESVTEGNK